ncbi:MAG: OmpA family protein [Gammaproteobacteria bacterium]
MKFIAKTLVFTLFIIFVTGCSVTKQLTREQMLQKYSVVQNLEQSVASARQKEINIFAPDSFNAAEQQLNTAYAAGIRDKQFEAVKAAKSGLELLKKASRDAKNSRSVLSEVVNARDKAIEAGALDLFPTDLTRLEQELSSTSNLIERGQLERAKQIRPRLRQSYSDLELRTLKEGTAQRAEKALQRARKNNAHKLAPRTFEAAEEALKIATTLIQANRKDRDKAEAAAQRAVILSNKSSNIAEIIKDFHRRDFEEEDIVLWYQSQLSKLSSPLKESFSFDEPNEETVHKIQGIIENLVMESELLAVTNQKLAEANDDIQSLIKKHEAEQAALTARQQEQERKFKAIQNLFSRTEAEVFRQNDNVLISAHGIKFPPGSSEIQPHSFSIMKKIIKSIQLFDKPKILVVGHTDSTGTPQINKKLSTLRARSVARFLIDIGGYPTQLIKSRGVGSEKPIASNATPEGRAKNRRINILIIN